MDALKNIQAKLEAPKGQFNKFGGYKYRSCEDILAAVKPLLEENNVTLVINDEIVLIGDRYYVKATATISDGENVVGVSAYAREPENKKGMDTAQITGATSSYARKYALNGLFAIDDTKDADATNTHGKYNGKTAADFIKLFDKSKGLEDLERIWKENASEINSMPKEERDKTISYCKQIKEVWEREANENNE